MESIRRELKQPSQEHLSEHDPSKQSEDNDNIIELSIEVGEYLKGFEVLLVKGKVQYFEEVGEQTVGEDGYKGYCIDVGGGQSEVVQQH